MDSFLRYSASRRSSGRMLSFCAGVIGRRSRPSCSPWRQAEVVRPAEILDGKVERTAQEAARRKFSPEFMNRLDKVVVFHPLRHVQLEQILDIELSMVQRRVLDTARGQFLFRVTPAARAFLLKEGTDMKYGARHLKRAIEKYLVYPLANLLATEQIALGDILCVDWDEDAQGLLFEKEGEGAVLPVLTPAPATANALAASASGGKLAEQPTKVAVREAQAPASFPPAAPIPAPASRRRNDP